MRFRIAIHPTGRRVSVLRRFNQRLLPTACPASAAASLAGAGEMIEI
jgi:hypothetical protein